MPLVGCCCSTLLSLRRRWVEVPIIIASCFRYCNRLPLLVVGGRRVAFGRVSPSSGDNQPLPNHRSIVPAVNRSTHVGDLCVVARRRNTLRILCLSGLSKGLSRVRLIRSQYSE